MLLDVIHAFLQGIGKFLHDIRILFHITGFRTVGSIRYITGIHTKGGNNITGSLLFKCSGGRFKLHCKIRRIIPCKSSSSSTEVDALINRKVFLRVKAILLQNIFKYHFRHATFSAAKDFPALQIFPFKIRHFFSCHKEISGPLGKLCKVYNRISSSFLIGIDRCFCSHKSDIRLAGYDGSHSFICPKASYKRHIKPLIFKISLFDCHILRCIKDGMGYFI